jgi:hypothetical protein
MTEAEWLACAGPTDMLEFLWADRRISDRKLRLFACACCRRIWHLLVSEELHRAVDVAERFADGEVADAERSDARKMAQQAAQTRAVTRKPTLEKWERRGASAVYYTTARDAMQAAYNTPQLAAEALVWEARGGNPFQKSESFHQEAIRGSEQIHQADLLRDIVGNPFRAATVQPNWQTPTVMALTRVAYTERTFDLLPILGDALEEAGCAEAGILSHCRQPGLHARGCWVVDCLLARE